MSSTPTDRQANGIGHKPSFRGLAHLLGWASALTLAPLLIVDTPGVGPRFVVGFYALAIVGLFGVSALYHRNEWSPGAQRIVRRVDHSMIFIAIAATYTPIAFFAVPTGSAVVVLAIVWIGAIVGIAGRVFWLDAPYVAVAVPYVVVGWAALVVIDDVWRSLGVAGFVLLLSGGLLYTAGAVVYAVRRPNPWPRTFGYHEVFHSFVVGGVAAHYVVIAFFVVPRI